MNTALEAILGSMVLILILVALILFGGEPDLADSLTTYIDKQTELLSCPKTQSHND